MPSRFGTTLLLSNLLVAAAAPCRAQTIADAYQAYVAGTPDAISRSFPDVQAFRDSREDLQRTLRLWIRSWKPSQAAFLLELSLVGFDRGWSDAAELMSGTRNLVVSRPTPPGANVGEDAFERAFHRAAVTFFLGRQMLTAADAYMNALAGRVDLVQATVGKPRLVDPWMVFARGMLADIRTAPALRGESDGSSSLAIPASHHQLRQLAQLAVSELERVRAAPEVAGEAAVRRALLLLRVDRPDDALAALDESDAATGDDAVRYFSALFRGRTLEHLARPADAAAAYERAAAIVPGAQTPAVALASLWQRHDRPAEALTWARRAMTTPAGTADPWWLYWRGDLRHASARLAVLRATKP